MSVSERLARIIPMLVEFFVLTIVVIGVHEYGHNVVAHWLGVPGHVEFTTLGGFFYYDSPATLQRWQQVLVALGGGGITALLAGGLWVMFHWQGHYEPGNLDEAAIMSGITVVQAIYAIGEGVKAWLPWAPWWSQLVGVLVAVAVVALLYARRILAWWEG